MQRAKKILIILFASKILDYAEEILSIWSSKSLQFCSDIYLSISIMHFTVTKICRIGSKFYVNKFDNLLLRSSDIAQLFEAISIMVTG